MNTQRKELGKLRCQLLCTIKQMTWDAGFRTSKRSSSKLNIRVGRVKVAFIRAQKFHDSIIRITVVFEDEKGNRVVNENIFGLVRTRSVKPFFRKTLKQLKMTCLHHVMSG